MNLLLALDVVYQAVDSVNLMRRPEEAIPRVPEVILVGEGGCLDSLALATLLLAERGRSGG